MCSFQLVLKGLKSVLHYHKSSLFLPIRSGLIRRASLELSLIRNRTLSIDACVESQVVPFCSVSHTEQLIQ